jgi:threonine synthase
LESAIRGLYNLNLEPSALAGFATYEQYRNQISFEPNETLIVTTGNSNNYNNALRMARLESKIDKK